MPRWPCCATSTSGNDPTARPDGAPARRPAARPVDAADAEVGEVEQVEQVELGDPQAVTTEGQTVDDRGRWADTVASAFGPAPDVSPTMAARLIRTGFIKIDSKGLFTHDLYVGADQVAEVRDDVVHLAVGCDELARSG